MSLDAGQIAGDGSTEIVAGSPSGKVAVFDTAIGQWVSTSAPLGKVRGGVRVAAVSAVGTSGSILVTTAARLPWSLRSHRPLEWVDHRAGFSRSLPRAQHLCPWEGVMSISAAPFRT